MAVKRTTVELLFVLVAALAAISCLARPDYNLPLFLFMWWRYFSIPPERKTRQQRFILAFVCISCLQDLFYVLFWSFKWFRPDWLSISRETEVVHIAVVVCGAIELLLKLNILAVLLVPGAVDETNKTCLRPQNHEWVEENWN